MMSEILTQRVSTDPAAFFGALPTMHRPESLTVSLYILLTKSQIKSYRPQGV